MEKFCPVCSRVYADDVTHCEVDNEKLVILREEPSLVGHVLDGKYTLKSKLGEGGMGSVYAAEQASMGREVAIKVLRREFSQNRLAIKRFLREARAASKLQHPNTITVYDFGQSNDGLLYLVMECLTGRPLADIMDDEAPLSVERAIHIMAQVLDSLSEAHDTGIAHRDLKPENIFIQQKVGNPDHVKVLDFGIAKMTGEDQTQATATGMICGTPAYMSPEQAMGRDIDGRSDIYALGILLYEMLTDEKPFDGDTPMEVMLKHINEPPPDIYQRCQISVPIGIQRTLDSMLAKRVEKRPATCQDVKKLLLEGMKTEPIGPITAVDDPNVPKSRRTDAAKRASKLEKTGLSPAVSSVAAEFEDLMPPRRTGAWMVLAAIVVLAIGGVLAFVLTQGDPGPPTIADAPPTSTAIAGTPTTTTTPTSPQAKPGVDTPPPTLKEPIELPPLDIAAGAVAGQLVSAVGPRSFELLALGRVEEPEMVVLTIRSEPSGAEVFEGDTLLGATPFDMHRAKDSGPVEIEIKMDRYKTKKVTFETGSNMIQTVPLKKRRRHTTSASGTKSGASGKAGNGKTGTGKDDGNKAGGGFRTF